MEAQGLLGSQEPRLTQTIDMIPNKKSQGPLGRLFRLQKPQSVFLTQVGLCVGGVARTSVGTPHCKGDVLPNKLLPEYQFPCLPLTLSLLN